jgi:hypothetical protein
MIVLPVSIGKGHRPRGHPNQNACAVAPGGWVAGFAKGGLLETAPIVAHAENVRF